MEITPNNPVSPRGFARFRAHCEQWAAPWDHRPLAIAALLACTFALMLVYSLQHRYWHDELFTYYIAQAPDLTTLIQELQQLDLNPPMVYAVTRVWQHLAGNGEIITRLPMSAAFLLASLAFYAFLNRRIGALWSAAAVILFWLTPYFRYATELRPYALLLMFFAGTLLAWDTATTAPKRTLPLILVALFGCCMMLTHVFAIFPLGAIYLAELTRMWRGRRLDLPLALVLLFPLCAIATYIPLMSTYAEGGQAYFPQVFQAGPRKIAVFFSKAVIGLWLPFALAALAAFVFSPPPLPRNNRLPWRVQDAGLLIGLFLTPFLVNIMLMRNHGAFFERYTVAAAWAVSISAVLLLATLTGFSKAAGSAALAVFLLFGLTSELVLPALNPIHIPPAMFEGIAPSLPLVAASGLTFLEMDHYEGLPTVSRLYYLTDRPSAIQFAHATIFEGIVNEMKFFPIRAHTEPYPRFTGTHKSFLLIGTPESAEDWMFRKLESQGAAIKLVSKLPKVYKDEAIYQVTLP